MSKVKIEYLFLDLNTCSRCIGTDQVLDEVIRIIRPAIELAGFTIDYCKIEIQNQNMAKEFEFLSSPTIRINGQDICKSVEENSCGCCSDISGTDVECRVFKYRGEIYEVPPKEMLAEEILKHIFGNRENECCCKSAYELSENLREFFEGKGDGNCSCEG